MRALVLNGALGPDPLVDELTARIARDLEAYDNASVDIEVLRDAHIAHCQGCFDCWTKTPGICKINDAGRDLARDFVASDVVVLVTPVQFGGYSSECKKMLDRTLGMLLPFFRRIDGEVHHAPRYAHPPAFGVVGVVDRRNAALEQTLRALVTRNAINFAAPAHAVGIVERANAEHPAFGECDTVIATLCGARSNEHVPIVDVDSLLPAMPLSGAGAAPTDVLLLVGSAKPRGTSTSEALGMHLLERLALRGVIGELRHLQNEAHTPEALRDLVAAVRAHSLVIISSPVYIDALPALVTRALEAIAADRAQDLVRTPLTIAMLLNCGFPESRHAAVARTIGALFARATGARWAGALQLGGGGVIDGRPFDVAGRVVAHLPALLDEAAAALAVGRAIPPSVQERFAQPLMGTSLYMAAGDAGWLWTAAHEGALTKMWQRPVNAEGTLAAG